MYPYTGTECETYEECNVNPCEHGSCVADGVFGRGKDFFCYLLSAKINIYEENIRSSTGNSDGINNISTISCGRGCIHEVMCGRRDRAHVY